MSYAQKTFLRGNEVPEQPIHFFLWGHVLVRTVQVGYRLTTDRGKRVVCGEEHDEERSEDARAGWTNARAGFGTLWSWREFCYHPRAAVTTPRTFALALVMALASGAARGSSLRSAARG